MIETMIAGTQGEPTMLPSNAINAFIALYEMMRLNLQFFDQHDRETGRALGHL
jgi:hypothetical protein